MALIFNENVKFDKFLIRKQVESIQSFSNKYVHQRSCQPYKVFPTSKEYDLKPYLKEMPGSEKPIYSISLLSAVPEEPILLTPFRSTSWRYSAIIAMELAEKTLIKNQKLRYDSERFHLQVPYIHLNYTYI